MAAELVRLKVDLIVTQGTPASLAAKRATATIPIVMPAVGDPVGSGLVTNLARPGGNITGFTYFAEEVNAKRPEILRETVPRIKRVAVLVNTDNPSAMQSFRATEAVAILLKIELQQFSVRRADDFEGVFAAMDAKRVDAVMAVDDAVLNVNAKRIADYAIKRRLPSIGIAELAEAGGLMSYGINLPALYRRGALLVDKILKGTKPGDISIERPTTFELVINQKAVKALGLTIPQAVLLRADRVIE